MAIRVDTNLRNDIIDNSVVMNLGTGDLQIRTGSQPASADDAASGTLLCTISITSGFGSAASGSASLASAPETGTAVATGTAGWARLVSGAMNIDGSVATSGGDFTINTLSIVSGGSVSLTACTLTMPSS